MVLRRFNKKLSLWTYHRIQGYIRYKALIEGIRILYVNPRNTSKVSPRGGNLEFINYRWVKLPNGIITTRDVIASWNLALRGLNLLTQDEGLRGSVEALKAPDQMQPQEGMRGKPVQVSIVSKISKIKSTGNHILIITINTEKNEIMTRVYSEINAPVELHIITPEQYRKWYTRFINKN
jgi:hypothetical protein